MEEKQASKGRQVYIQAHLVPLIEQYARDNQLDIPKAVNEIISDHFRRPASDDNSPATKRDIKRVIKRIELTNMMFEPALLELLEATSSSRFDAKENSEIGDLGREIKRRYVDLFRELREMIQ